ncbi:glycosyltransferase family 4 protein [Nocardioides panacisoli]|uniref:glycosyltransferase family 4 protein n=1 Tax=Nocardioides panacisoli TaxID=627624 RepID=UPI001C629BAA|nr:glycosyltransferase family 4 protein [Nocardioides panacisoli]QYJ04788.1 glycosyltransferase family 4 protein [Nocardioides panacisoli]
MEVWEDLQGRDVVFLSWRDARNPEGGGAELYLENIATGLARHGCRVTVFTAAYDGGAADEVVDGVRYVRRGSRLSVYWEGMRALRRGDLGDPDVVVDIQNGLPFFSRLVTRRPSIVLVHHVHREQWPVVFPGPAGRVGWWIERRFAPWLYRHCQYVAVSRATRDELCDLGVDRSRIAVVHNGTSVAPLTGGEKARTPTVTVVGRLVPHKQVEHAVDAVRAARAQFPDLRLEIVGDGWWRSELETYVDQRGAREFVSFLGHVDEAEKHSAYKRSWLLLLPSLKEGWGLVIGEAGMHSTPTIAYRAAGGTRESIDDGVSGVLVDDPEEFTNALRELLGDEMRRKEMGKEALAMSFAFSWERAEEAFGSVVHSAVRGEVVAADEIALAPRVEPRRLAS